VKLTGLGVSPGVAVGRALVFRQHTFDIRFRVSPQAIDHELGRLQQARDRSRRQIVEIKDRIARTAGSDHAYLFEAQLLMLDDPMLADRAVHFIRAEHMNAEWAVRRAGEELTALFDQTADPYLRERKGDVADVMGRIRLNLRPQSASAQIPGSVEGPVVLVADELAPSTAAQVDWRRVVGFATDVGSWTYHTAILARSLHVPAVVGLHDASTRIPAGATVAVDGSSGEVIVDPSPDLLAQIDAWRSRDVEAERALEEFRHGPAVTADGVRIRLEANIERPEEVVVARKYGAEGIGLYRSEFLLIRGAGAGLATVDEDAQYAAYRTVLEQMAPERVTVRTFDVGEDDLYPGSGAAHLSRPVLGRRGIRLSLAHPDLFKTQLRALLRAARHGALRIMFPFVSGAEEIRAARAVLAGAVDDLRARGDTPPAVPVGIMIEVPSAALTADLLAADADFFSVGTNDLIQCCLAVDRSDDRVSRLYEPCHPAVLRVLRHVSRSARRAALPLSLCGEMAAEPGALALLIGLGITEFSMVPTAIPMAKRVIRDLRADEARRAAAKALRAATVADVERAVEAVRFTHNARRSDP
jgi:phosphotransferase system enzyme I (PtsI)